MQYLDTNYRTKAEAQRALKAGLPVGIKIVEPMEASLPRTVNDLRFGECVEHAVAGPWFPEPHRWYGTARVKDGRVIGLK